MGVAEWYFLQGTKEAGPFTRDQILSLFSSGAISEETHLWRPGYSDWRPLSAFSEFVTEPPRPRYEDKQRRRGRSLAAPRQSELPAQHNGGGHEAPPLNHPRQWVDAGPHPWRRYFARFLDNVFWGVLLLFLLGFGVAVISEPMAEQLAALLYGPAGQLIGFALMIVLITFANAVMIGLTGGNLGKWLFGVCILDESDRPIGIVRSFKREGRVLFHGLGLGIPIVTLVTMIIAYQRLKQDGATSWDQALAVKVVQRRNGFAQFAGAVLGVILLIAITGLALWINRLPQLG